MAHPGPIVDTQHVHPGAVVQAGQQLGGEEKVLGAGDVTRGPHQKLEHPPLVPRVHPLVDLVHTPEGDGGQLLEGEHVQRGGHTPLAPGLVVGGELLQVVQSIEIYSFVKTFKKLPEEARYHDI